MKHGKYHASRHHRRYRVRWHFGKCSSCSDTTDVAKVGSMQLCKACIRVTGGDMWRKGRRALKSLLIYLKKAA